MKGEVMLVVQLHPLLPQKLQNLLLPPRRGSGAEASTVTVLPYSQTSGIALIHCSTN